MGITVQKYGGSSLATDRQLLMVARRVARAHRTGAELIVVVSARGDTTDQLVRAAAAVSAAPDPVEADKVLATGENLAAALLAIALRDLGVPAVSLTGPQAGLRATGRPGLGMIATVDVAPVRAWLGRGHVVVVAGFQAAGDHGDVITLGRGGSDTTAVALAAAHGAARCEIYTDVDGVRGADPRIVADPVLLPEIDADVMAEMAFSGARVLHSRAVELAAAYGIDVTVRSSAGRGRGSTIIGRRTRMLDAATMEGRAGVSAITHDPSVAQLVVRTSGRLAARAAAILDALARRQIVVDAVVWRTGPELEMSCCVADAAVVDAMAAVHEAVGADSGSIWARRSVGTVSVVGTGLLSRPGLTALAMRALIDAGIDADCVSCTQSRTTFLVDQDHLPTAVTVLYRRFNITNTEDNPNEDDPALATA